MSTMPNLPSQPNPGAPISPARAAIALGRWWAAYTAWRIDRLAASRLGAMDDREVNRPDDAWVTPLR